MLGSWARIPDLVPQNEILESLGDPAHVKPDATDADVMIISDYEDDEEGVEIPPTSGTEDFTSEAESAFD